MSTTIDLGKDLATCYTERAERQLDIERIEREIYKREIALTPAEGWPGKNAEQREIEKARALAADEIYNGLEQARIAQVTAQTLLTGTIEGLEAERRGFEWQIRANLVMVLAGAAIERSGSVQEQSETAFDDAAQDVVDDEILYQAVKENMTPVEVPGAMPDDVGFEDHPIELVGAAQEVLDDWDNPF